MKEALLVFAGGGMGSLMRFFLHRLVQQFVPAGNFFPFGTLAVNVAACFLLGLVIGAGTIKNYFGAPVHLFLAVGICGGFSTFSTFSAEILQLFQSGAYISAFAYILSSIIVGIAAVALGIFLFKIG